MKATGLLATFVLGMLVAPLAANAQSPAKVPRLGVLGTRSPSEAEEAAFWHAMRELGWVEGQNLAVERRYAEGHYDRLPTFAAELVHLPVDVLLVNGTPETLAAKHATTTIPIIMAGSGDPVGSGIIESLARPGGNITGMSFMETEIIGKRLEFLREALPSITRVAVLTSRNPIEVRMLRTMEEAAPRLGLTLHIVEARSPDDFDAAFATILTGRAEALHVMSNGPNHSERRRITDFAAQHGLPVTADRRLVTEVGGLMSYQHHLADTSQRIARYVDKILKGAKPADLPVEQPTKFELLINLKTAKALGLPIPPMLLFQADEVIQ